MKLSILICTVKEREQQFRELYNKLHTMCSGYDIEILFNDAPRWDEPEGLTVGEKRQALIDVAKGKYICFVDDDDNVSAEFIEELYPILDKDVDVINAMVLADINGRDYLISQSIQYGRGDLNQNGITNRYPSVMSVWNRDLTKKAKFKALNNGEDFDWTTQMNPKTEIKVDSVWHYYNYSDETTIASKTPKRCIVTFSNTDRYNRLAARLKESAKPYGYDFLHFNNFDEISCRHHSEYPYAFKPYAIHKCRDLGYNSILWIDSAIYLTQDPIEVFKFIEKNGVMLFDNIGHNMGTYTNDDCLAHFNLGREQSFDIKMVMACSMGFYFHNKKATKVFEEWMGKAHSTAFQGAHEQPNGKVKGHRHDQSAISCIAHNKGIELIHPSKTFIAYNSWPLDEMPRAETVCMISAG